MALTSDSNKLDLVEGVSYLPWDWRNLGSSYEDGRAETSTSVAARCSFTLRRGFDSLDGVDYGRVAEGVGDVGLNLRAGPLVFHLGASNYAVKAGSDAPLAAAAPPGNGALAGLRVTVAREFAPDAFAAASYDAVTKKPELSLAWAGETFTERAALSVHFDPIDRLATLRAAVAFPGPEWREDVYDEVSSTVQAPRDDGARHAVWVEHSARAAQPLVATRVGASLDLGRLVNYAADFVDYSLSPMIPGIFWRLPLAQRLYNVIIPAENEHQERHQLRGLAVEFRHDFARRGPTVGLSQKVGPRARASALYDTDAKAATLRLRVGGLAVGATATRADGAGWREWSAPALSLMIEPLAFL